MSEDWLLTRDELRELRRKFQRGLLRTTLWGEAVARAQHEKDKREFVDLLEEPCPHGTLAADTSHAMKRECETCWQSFKEGKDG